MQSGARLGAYELVEELGAGGMGVVWRAHDRRLGRDVALKVLPPQLAAHPDALLRFEREARGLAALSHPNIVSIFDLGEEGELRYIVTEVLEGETLRETLRRGPLSWPKFVEICATIADGLAAAHAKGILHRDLKPENIFLTREGRVKILDFGLAKEVALSHSNATTMVQQTEPGRVLGTLGYTSPEQLRGEEMDFASDIFSLGCVLFEMMSGCPAFLRNSSAETIAAILTEEPPPLHTMTGAPPELSRIVQRCMEKRRAARFQSASDLAFALRASDGVVQASGLPSGGGRTGRPEAHTTRWIILALVMAAIAAAAILWPRATPHYENVSLAIIPFSADPEHAYAAEGIAESLFRRLAPLRSVRVVSRKTTENTGANHLLQGAITRNGIRAEIVELSRSRRVWQRTYRGDLLDQQRRLSSDVEQFLRSYAREETAAAPPSPSTVDAEAYREYLKGRHHWNKFTLAGFTQSLEHFQKSIDHDPTYALAYTGLADAYMMLAFHGSHAAETIPKARAAARRATELDPRLGEAYTSLGTVLLLYDWNWRGAEEALRRGVELNTRYATAHHAYASYLGVVGRAAEALREIEVAAELDPLSLVIYIDVAWIHYINGNAARAVEVSETAIRHDPRSPLVHYEMIWYLESLGRYAEAVDAYERALRLDGKNLGPATRLRAALQRGGRTGYLREKLAMSDDDPTRAALLAWLGENEAAIDALERGYRARERDMIYIKSSPTYTALHGHPRFEKLIAEMWP